MILALGGTVAEGAGVSMFWGDTGGIRDPDPEIALQKGSYCSQPLGAALGFCKKSSM
jgi:hypothetical protein